MIRRAEFDDIPQLIGLVRRLVASTGVPQNVDDDRVRAVLMAMMVRADAAVWVSPMGFLAATIEHTVISFAPIAAEHGWYAEDGQGLRLLREFEAWADARGATPRLSTGMTGLDLGRIGYRAVEMAWVRA